MPLFAVEDGGAGVLVHDMDVRADIEAAGLDPPDILRQPADAVPVRPLQVGRRHQVCDRCCIGVRQAHRDERLLNEGLQPGSSDRCLGQDGRSLRPAGGAAAGEVDGDGGQAEPAIASRCRTP